MVVSLFIGFFLTSRAQPDETTTSIQWLGHATFKITTSDGKTVLIDPWITDNPKCPINLSDITEADIILVTHDHFDHISDVVELANTTGATVVCQPETAQRLISEKNLSKSQVIHEKGMNTGGSVKIENVTITMTQAFHSSETGDPTGYIIRTKDGTTIYHAGDTGIFQSMKLLGEIYDIDIALLPIGSVFTMDPIQAAHSLKLIKPKIAIPMHYGTFPILIPTTDEFVTEAHRHAPNVKIVTLNTGETYEYNECGTSINIGHGRPN
ncbi:MAG: metal-dependent hydrolase [Methanosarcinales archaeon]|nr:MAG: metal-dependent hydrolase [Methanosarcinales archaeon]